MRRCGSMIKGRMPPCSMPDALNPKSGTMGVAVRLGEGRALTLERGRLRRRKARRKFVGTAGCRALALATGQIGGREKCHNQREWKFCHSGKDPMRFRHEAQSHASHCCRATADPDLFARQS